MEKYLSIVIKASGKNRVADVACLFFVVTSVLLSLSAYGQTDESVNEQLVTFDIPRQRADLALTEFAEQADLTLIFPDDLVRDKSANTLIGAYSLEEAIEVLLSGTGLDSTFSNRVVLSIAVKRQPLPQGEDMRVRKKAGLLGVLAAVFTSAGAQERTDNEDLEKSFEEIVVTGTHIRGIESGASPLISFDREQIEQTGFGSTQEFVESLPQNFGGGASSDNFNTPTNAVGNNIGRGSSINLRGLGEGATLVLLNGHRLTPAGRGTFFDVSNIPLSAVERVEILADGASAIYGSDAVAGVVNFQLRQDYEGAETRLRYGSVTEGELDEWRVSQVFGKHWGSGNALVGYEYFERGPLSVADRDFAFQLAQPTDILPGEDRHSLLVSLNQEVTDGIDLFGDLLYTQRGGDQVRTTTRTSSLDIDVEQYSVTLGADVNVGRDWRIEVVGDVGGNDEATRTVSSSGNIFGGGGKFDLWTVNTKADGPLFELAAGKVRLAVGASYRHEELNKAGFFNATASDVTIDREVAAVFGEVFVPLVGENNRMPGLERLELTVAARHEDYSDFGSTTKPKVGVLWSPFAGVNLRGTYNQSFKAPTLQDLDTSDQSLVIIDLLAFGFGPFPSPPFTPGEALIFNPRGNADNIGPEQSTAWTVGIDVEPTFAPSLALGLTYFEYDYTDRIDLPAGSLLDPLNSPFIFADILTINPSAAEVVNAFNAVSFSDVTDFTGAFDITDPLDVANVDAILDIRTTNLGATKINGLDFSANYQRDTDMGAFSLGMHTSYLFTREESVTPNAPLFDTVDTIYNPVDMRTRANLSWARQGFRGTAFINYIDSYTDTQPATPVKVDSWTTMDVNLSYNTEDRFDSAWSKNMALSLSIQNLFDKAPPAVAANALNVSGYDPTNATPLGRFIAFELKKIW